MLTKLLLKQLLHLPVVHDVSQSIGYHTFMGKTLRQRILRQHALVISLSSMQYQGQQSTKPKPFYSKEIAWLHRQQNARWKRHGIASKAAKCIEIHTKGTASFKSREQGVGGCRGGTWYKLGAGESERQWCDGHAHSGHHLCGSCSASLRQRQAHFLARERVR